MTKTTLKQGDKVKFINDSRYDNLFFVCTNDEYFSKVANSICINLRLITDTENFGEKLILVEVSQLQKVTIN